MQRTEILPGVHRFTDGLVNWYLVQEGDRIVAVDAGFPAHYGALKQALEELGGTLTDMLLTHSHVDHVGWAESARKDFGATIRLHVEDVAFARSPLPLAPSERNPLLYALRHGATRRLYLGTTVKRGPFGQRISEYTTVTHGETLTGVPGSPRVIFCPGHSKGHVAYHFAGQDVLFAGDAIVTRNPYTGETGPRIVAAAATWRTDLNLETIGRLAETGAQTVLTGHGEPWTQGAHLAVEQARAAGVS